MANQQPSLPFYSPFPAGKPGGNRQHAVASAESSLPPTTKLQKPCLATAGSARARGWSSLALSAPLFLS